MGIRKCLICCIAAVATTPAFAADIAIIHAGHLLAVPGTQVTTEQSVVIRDGKVVSVSSGYIDASAAGAGAEDKVEIHDLKNMFVLPGLIDGHVHLTEELGPRSKLETVERSDPDVAMFGARSAKLTLISGFTTVRDVGAGGGDAIFALRHAVNIGYVPGPRIFASGSTISPTGGHAQRHGYRDEIMQLMASPGVCDGVDSCRQAVRLQVKRGADHIKLVSTGGVLSETAAGTGQQFFEDELKAIMDTSHALGRRVTAHAHGTDGINAALRAGVDAIEHGSFSDKESFRLFKRKGAFLVPTILAGVTVMKMAEPDDTFMPPAIRAKALAVGPQMLDMVRRAHKANVKIAFGTDSGVSRHGQNAREFGLLVEAGMSPMEAIHAATVNGAANLGKTNVLGTIEPGKYGDLIAVNGDPLSDISELEDVDFVMKEGVVYKKP